MGNRSKHSKIVAAPSSQARKGRNKAESRVQLTTRSNKRASCFISPGHHHGQCHQTSVIPAGVSSGKVPLFFEPTMTFRFCAAARIHPSRLLSSSVTSSKLCSVATARVTIGARYSPRRLGHLVQALWQHGAMAKILAGYCRPPQSSVKQSVLFESEALAGRQVLT